MVKTLDVLCAVEHSLRLTGHELILELIDILAQLVDFAEVALDLVHDLQRSGLEPVGDLIDHTGHRYILCNDLAAGDGLDAAHAGGDGTL